MKKIICALLVVAFLISGQLIAFGPTGHRIVGELASHYLSAKSKAAIVQILGTGSFQKHSLARVATWSDEIRSSPEWSKAKKDKKQWNAVGNNTLWHYATVNKPEDLANLNKVPADIYDGMIVLKLQESEDILRGKIEGNKEEALKWLVHLVGDIHQPLHVGSGTDRGGNSKAVRWFNKADNPTNLHSVWDSYLVDNERLSYTEYTAYLLETTSEEDVKTWVDSDYIGWATESDAMRKEIYKSGNPNWENLPKLEYQYVYDNKPRLEQRLKQGGVRLGHLLNSIFENQ